MNAFAYRVIFCFAWVALLAAPALAAKEPPPAGNPARPFKIPGRQDLLLPNGLRVTVVPYGVTPKLTFWITIAAGSVTERPDQIGLTQLVTTLMQEGTTTRSAEQIAREAGDMGGVLQIVPGADEILIAFSVLSDFAVPAAALLADIVQHPRFPESELARVQNNMIREVTIERLRPTTLAAERFRGLLYPAHPYGYALPTEAQIKSFDIGAVKDYYNQNFGAARTRVYAAGKLPAGLADAIAGDFRNWKPGPGKTPPEPKPSFTRHLDVIDRPGAVQSSIYLGLPIADPTNPDYIALQVMDALLGGSFGSRITANIREQKGYTYSPHSMIVPRKRSAFWAEVADVTTAVTGAAMMEILKEINRLRSEAPSAEELKNIQEYLAGNFILNNSARQDVIGQLVFVDRYGLGADYLSRYVQKVMAVTPAQVQAMAEKYLTPSKMTMVVVGDKAKIDEQLAALP